MARRNQQQWLIRYRGHKTLNMDHVDWITMVTWDRKIAEKSQKELQRFWKQVEVVPFTDPVRKRQQNTGSEWRRDRDDEE